MCKSGEVIKRILGKGVLSYLLKFATMIGIGRVMQRTPQIAQREPMNFPAAVVGATSP